MYFEMNNLNSAGKNLVEVHEDSIIPETQQFEIETPNHDGVVFYSIKLFKGISKINFASAQLSSLLYTLHIFITDTLQPFILLDQGYYNINIETSGTLLGILQVILLIVKILGCFVFGHLIDRFGRRTMFIVASFLILFGCFLAPNQSSVFPGYLTAVVLMACGSVIFGNMPFIADYVHDASKGKAAGISMTLAGIGAIIGNLILKFFLYANYTLGQIYVIWGIASFVLFNILAIGLKGGKYYLENTKKEEVNEEGKFWRTLKEAFAVLKRSPWLIIGLIVQALGTSDFYVLTVIMSLFIKHLYPANTPDSVSNIKVSNIQTLTLAPSTIANVIYGVYIDRTNKIMNAINTSLIGGIVGFGIIFTVQTPDDFQIYVAVVMLGCILTGIYTASAYLTTKHFPEDIRGILTGIMSAVGFVGYIVLALGGGYLYDVWMPSAPFLINLVVMVFVLIGVNYIYRTKIANKT